MRRLSLSTLLIGANVGLVCVAVLCVAAAAASRLGHLADQQAVARVGTAGETALQALERATEEVVASSRVLAERPTLTRLLQARDASSLAPFLDQFGRRGHLSGCAVIIGGEPFAQGGQTIPWSQIAPGAGGEEGRFLAPVQTGGPLALVASCPISEVPGAAALCAILLDEEFAGRLGRQAGLSVSIVPTEAVLREMESPREPLRSRVLSDQSPASARLEADQAYVAVLPLRAPSGAVMGVVETSLPTTGVTASVRGLVRSLLLLSLVVAGLATLFSVLIGRWLARPLASLTMASARIGTGDLDTPIPRAPGAETGTLAATMEEMRRRLFHLTGELRRRQSEAEAILGGIAEGVFAVDRERRIRYVNPNAASLLGVSPQDALGRFCGDLLNPQGPGGERPCEMNCPIVHARFRGTARATEQLLLPGGLRRMVVILSSQTGPTPSWETSSGGPAEEALQFQVMRDETEVEAGRRLRDAVLANISHEFRTPLTAQLASIELLRDRLADLDAPEAHQLIQSLERGTLRLTQLIDNLLESVRIEAGQLSIRGRPVALDEVIEQAVELTAPLISLKKQALSVDLPYPLPPVTGDAPRLVQVFVNLLANANKFAPLGSTVSVGGSVGGGEVTLWVEDQGPGLPPGARASLFERFVRSPARPGTSEPDAGEEPEQSGMGLGLWIVKSIVERHGGRVEARGAAARGTGGSSGAPAPGDGERCAATGTRMCVILPLERPDEDPRR